MSSARSCLPSGKGNACRFGTASPFRCTQLRPLGTPTRQHRRRIPLQSIQRVQATAVSTSNDYSLGNSLSENSFEVKGDIEKVFQYAADFSHIDRWDSGTTDAKLRESSKRGAFKVGDTVSLMTVLLGVKTVTVYQLLEMEGPNKAVFFGISRFHESTDVLTFTRKPGSEDIVQVNYTTKIELVRWYKYFQFFLGFLMGNLAQEAVEGLQEKLQQMQEQGKLVSEKASAAR
ncbi:hypothetical protein WJX79_005760 [Trebouxia sp. C0005]